MRAADGSFAIGQNMFHFFSSLIWYCQKDLFVIVEKDSSPVEIGDKNERKIKTMQLFSFHNEFTKRERMRKSSSIAEL